MTTKKQTPEATKAPEKRDAATDEPVTKLADVGNPATLTKADIDEIAGKDRDPAKAEESANADVAETLKQAKADAKDDPDAAYFAGQGGATGL